MSWDVITGDCLAAMPGLAPDGVDAVVCDPPYGLSFMGRDWDRGVPGPAFWAEAERARQLARGVQMPLFEELA